MRTMGHFACAATDQGPPYHHASRPVTSGNADMGQCRLGVVSRAIWSTAACFSHWPRQELPGRQEHVPVLRRGNEEHLGMRMPQRTESSMPAPSERSCRRTSSLACAWRRTARRRRSTGARAAERRTAPNRDAPGQAGSATRAGGCSAAWRMRRLRILPSTSRWELRRR
jgi:hypothetical protein